MNALVSTAVCDLPAAAGGLPRSLNLRLHRKGSFIVKLSLKKQQNCVVFAHGPLAECYLDLKCQPLCLWVGSTAFDVTPKEAESIRFRFEGLGLRVVRQ